MRAVLYFSQIIVNLLHIGFLYHLIKKYDKLHIIPSAKRSIFVVFKNLF